MKNTERIQERGGALQVILAIIGGLVVLSALVAVVTLWVLRHYMQVDIQRSGGAKEVSIRTPVGSIEVRKAHDVAQQLKLPVYPGATPEDESASVRLRGRLGDEEGGLDIVAAKFLTSDDFDNVDAWYRQQLGPEFTREKGRIKGTEGSSDWKITVEPGGDDVLYSQSREGRVRGVVLKHQWARHEIALFDVAETSHQ
ncbi:MAG: hypothetical protein ACRD35_06090 [Candidatus Acidiferrales bacterium]